MKTSTLETHGILIHETVSSAQLVRDYLVDGDIYRLVYDRRSTVAKVYYGGMVPRSLS